MRPAPTSEDVGGVVELDDCALSLVPKREEPANCLTVDVELNRGLNWAGRRMLPAARRRATIFVFRGIMFDAKESVERSSEGGFWTTFPSAVDP